MARLDKTGLARFWQHVTALVSTKANVTDLDGKLSKSGDTMTGNLEMNDNTIYFGNHEIYGTENALVLDGYGSGGISLSTYDGGQIQLNASSGEINVSQDRIVNLGTPTADTDAATKQYVDNNKSLPVVTTTGDGAAYTATVPGITALTAGASFIMVPHTSSTSTTPTLNANGLGAKKLYRRNSMANNNFSPGFSTSWLVNGWPCLVIYTGTYWVVEGLTQPSVSDLQGTVAANQGGTGVTSISSLKSLLDLPIIFSGSYSGNGDSSRTIKLGSSVPQFLVIVRDSGVSSIDALALIANNVYGCGFSGAPSGIYVSLSGSSASVSSSSIYIGSSSGWNYVTVNGSGASSMNVSGYTYYYFGVIV